MNTVSHMLSAPTNWGVQQIKRLPLLCDKEVSILTKLSLPVKAIVGLAVAILGAIPAMIGKTINYFLEKQANAPIKEIKFKLPVALNVLQAEIDVQKNAIDEFGLTKEMVGLIYHMCKEFNEVAEQFDIKYVASGGTFIGAVRHEGFIPWDDDADLQLLLGEEDKLAEKIPGTNFYKVKPEFEKALADRGLKMAGHWGGWKLCPIECPSFGRAYYSEKPLDRQFCFPFVDVFISKKLDARRIDINCIANTSLTVDKVANWEHFWIPNIIKPVGTMQFGPIKMPMPFSTLKECEAYISRAYNPTWKTKAVIAFNHKTGKGISPAVEFRLTDYRPAAFEMGIFETGKQK